MPNSILLRVLGDKAYGVAGFDIAMRLRRPVTDYIAGYTFNYMGSPYVIMR